MHAVCCVTLNRPFCCSHASQLPSNLSSVNQFALILAGSCIASRDSRDRSNNFIAFGVLHSCPVKLIQLFTRPILLSTKRFCTFLCYRYCHEVEMHSCQVSVNNVNVQVKQLFETVIGKFSVCYGIINSEQPIRQLQQRASSLQQTVWLN